MGAIIRVVEDLPLVPTPWMDSNARSGCPSAVIRRRIRSRPKRIPNSSSESSQRSASGPVTARDPPSPLRSQRVTLRPQPRQLVALGLDDLRARLGHERLIGELALGALDLAVELGASLGHALLGALHVNLGAGEDMNLATGDGHRGDRLAAVGGPVETEAGQTAHVLDRVLVSGGLEPGV